jgi:hypothetical protein
MLRRYALALFCHGGKFLVLLQLSLTLTSPDEFMALWAALTTVVARRNPVVWRLSLVFQRFKVQILARRTLCYLTNIKSKKPWRPTGL